MGDFRAMMEEQYAAVEQRMERRLMLKTEGALERGLGHVGDRMAALETKVTDDLSSSLSAMENILRRGGQQGDRRQR